ncbi:MAG: nitroreductase family protein [Clostridiaceae bacterium]
MVGTLVEKNRSYRKFHEDVEIERATLEELINLARLSPCGMNLQCLRFMLITDTEDREKIYPTIKWAAFLKEWGGPVEGQRPTGFILMFTDKSVQNSFVADIDMGIACQSILLGAVEKGLGGCIIGAIDKNKVISALNVKEHLELKLIIALGAPDQNIIIDDAELHSDLKYWEDKSGNHHVPKLMLKDLIVEK